MKLFDPNITPEEQELKWYVDREEVLGDFGQRLNWESGALSKVVMYHGIGGIGKTSIRKMAEDRFLKPHEVPYAVVYYEPDGSPRSPEGTFAYIRHQLGRFGLRFPIFDTIWSIHWEATTRQRIPKTDLPTEISAAASVISVIPVIGPVLGNIPQAVIGAAELTQSAAEWISGHFRGGIAQLRQMDSIELLHQMPQAMAQDLEDLMRDHNHRGIGGNFRIAVIFDGFERLAENGIDDWFVREFCRSTASTLKVIFGREVLHWERYDPTWKEFIDHYQLTNLTPHDGEEYLQRRSVHDSNLRRYIVERTDGFPLHLRLSADICQEIETKGNREPRIDDLVKGEQGGDVEGALYASLLREVPNDERHAAMLAAIPRWFNQEILEILLAEPASAPYLFQMLTYFSLSEKQPILEDSYIIRKEARQLLLGRARRLNRWLEWNKRLVDYHAQRHSDLTHLAEELHHKFIVEPQEALQLFRNAFYRNLEMERFGNCLTLLQAIPDSGLPTMCLQWINLARTEFIYRGSWPKGGTEATKVLTPLVQENLSPELCARALRLSGLIYAQSGENDKAIELFNQAIALFDSLGEWIMKAATLRDAGQQHFLLGNYHDALQCSRHALHLARRIKPIVTTASKAINAQTVVAEAGFTNRPLAYILNWIASTYARTGRMNLAIKPFQEMLKEGQERGNLRQQAEVLSELGLLYRRLGRLRDAQIVYEQALPIFETIGSTPNKANVLCGLGMTLEQGGDFEAARPHYENALELWKELGDKSGEAKTWFCLARVEHHAGNMELARQFYDKAIRFYREAGFVAHVGPTLLSLAKLKASLGEWEEAAKLCKEALSLFEGLEDRAAVAATHNNLGMIYYFENEIDSALSHWKQARGLYARIVSSRKVDDTGHVHEFTLNNIHDLWVNWLSMYDFTMQKQTLKRLRLMIAHPHKKLSENEKEPPEKLHNGA